MKTKFAALLLLLSTLLLTSCATLMGAREVEVPLATLQRAMADKFPFNNRYLDLLDVTVSNPRLSLQPDTDRLVSSMDAMIAPPFLNKSWNGSFTVSGKLRFDPARNAIVLGEPRMEKFNLDGLDPRYGNVITKIGILLTEQVLQDAPLYTFRPEELRYGGTDYTLSKITTRADRIVVTFEPLK
ncbi:DUF1439 domain-containing protein [Noviherbaspirillum cavernae]|uniref:DUF1439 domain-containing protein n=1 Tax=Noviherbaspirillum cavernae TaxID=2320862 RepID=A0A418WY27_9BURK|nr:DUF1439 domain-containing protein [Noviherbaspirillum cavernae]RJG05139.1 DUF1439 domain-containing protein [Noviherbaspirillum cavernae]